MHNLNYCLRENVTKRMDSEKNIYTWWQRNIYCSYLPELSFPNGPINFIVWHQDSLFFPIRKQVFMLWIIQWPSLYHKLQNEVTILSRISCKTFQRRNLCYEIKQRLLGNIYCMFGVFEKVTTNNVLLFLNSHILRENSSMKRL